MKKNIMKKIHSGSIGLPGNCKPGPPGQKGRKGDSGPDGRHGPNGLPGPQGVCDNSGIINHGWLGLL